MGKLQPAAKLETDTPPVRPPNRRKLVLVLLSIILLLPLAYWYLPQFPVSVVGGKRDDWQFTPTAADSPSFLSTARTILASLNPQKYLLMLLLTALFTLIPVSTTYLVYRFWGGLIRLFRKQLYFGSRRSILKYLLLLVLGVGSAVAAGYLSIRYPNYLYPVLGSSLIVGASIAIALPLALIYFLVQVVKSFKKPRPPGAPRKALMSFSFLSLSVIFLGLSFGWFIIRALFGVQLLSMSIPTSGGGGGGSYYGAISNPAFSGLSGVSPLGSINIGKSVSDNIGFSVGGAKDINNFRENIKNHFLPIETDITYEGLFYDYYFDTGVPPACDQLFCPAYSYVVSPDPVSQQPENYLSVGLNSGLQKTDFTRKKLNLVIVLDISGSMGSLFNTYYYDDPQKNATGSAETKTKMQVADESVVALLSHLMPDDRFGMVLFDEVSYLAKPLRQVADTDMTSLASHILDILPQGSTNMEAGYRSGTDLLAKVAGSDPDQYENRIVFLTDAQPNTGVIDKDSLAAMTKANADRGIYTTFVGIGVDFNTQLTEAITKIRGANYYAVHNSRDFAFRLDQGFDYMVTPLVFDLNLKVTSDAFQIDRVYGSPEADLATGEIMRVNTLFPSDSTSAGVKGGLVLLKLRRVNDGPQLVKLAVSYLDRSGQPHTSVQDVDLSSAGLDVYPNTGIQKGLLLARYANLLKNWIHDERASLHETKPLLYPRVNIGDGIPLPETRQLSEWERTSVPLTVSPAYKNILATFKDYFTSQASQLADPDLTREIDTLTLLTNQPAVLTPTPPPWQY